MSGSKYTWSSMNSYFASYLHYNGNEWVKPRHTYLLMPATDFINNCVLNFGVVIYKKLGLRYLILIALGFLYLACFFLIFFQNYFIVIMAMGIFGVGCGFSYFPPIQNCWKYFPKSNALIFGVCVAGLGLSSSILTPLADYAVVNPNKQKTDDDGYYPQDVANNLKTYLYILTGIYVFLGVVAFLFSFEYQEKEPEKDEKLIDDKNQDEGGANDKIEAQETEEKEVKEKKSITWKELFQLLKTKKYLMLLSFCVCGLCKYNNIKIYILYILIYSYNF